MGDSMIDTASSSSVVPRWCHGDIGGRGATRCGIRHAKGTKSNQRPSTAHVCSWTTAQVETSIGSIHHIDRAQMAITAMLLANQVYDTL